MRAAPTVGDFATYHIGSDSYAYSVTEVSKSGHRVTLRRCKSRRVDSNGMSELQRWINVADPNGLVLVATRRRDGEYLAKGCRFGVVVFGKCETYLDPGF